MTKKPSPRAQTKTSVTAELAELAAKIAKADQAYHGDDAPEMTDAEYDALRRRHAEILEAHPDLATPDATEAVGAPPAAGFGKWPHGVPMLSLDNAFAAADFEEFEARIRRFLGFKTDNALHFLAEPKLD